jgi:DNA-directed RNA polymerase specialized sigma24 family protein
MPVPQTSNRDGERAVAGRVYRGPPVAPNVDVLDEYLQRTAAGDRTAFRTLCDLLSPYVRDSAACLFGSDEIVDNVTSSVFVDVWQLAGQYQPGGEGVRTWVLNIAGTRTMSRYRPH